MNDPRVPFVRTDASVLLDLVRGLAAVLVVIGHARNFLFVDYTQLASHSLWTSIFYLVSKTGREGVVVFFVLSGYLISGSVFRAVERHTWSWPSYLTHRLVRLWVVLLPGLLLCLLIDHIAIAHHLAPALYQAGAPNHMSVNVAAHLTPTIFFRNLFFLGVIAGPVFGSDTALWSLPYEFWYYILFPLGLFAFARVTSLRKRLITALLFVIGTWFTHIVLPSFPIWLTGTLLAVIPPPRFSPRSGPIIRWLVLAAYICFFFLFAGVSGRLPALAADYILAIVTFFFLLVLLSATNKARQTSSVRATRELARFSYTLYVVHTPFLLLLTSLIVGESRWTPNPLAFLKCVGIVAVVMVYAYIIASLTEFHTDTVRRWVEERLALLSLPTVPRRAQAQTTVDTMNR